jgi:hypothetical protein
MQINTETVRVFQERTLPTSSRLVGWSALVHTLGVQAPVRRPHAVSEQHARGSRKESGDWVIFDKNYWPGEDFAGHMNFALRHEDLDLLILKRLFEAVPLDVVQKFVRSAPTGLPSRRV